MIILEGTLLDPELMRYGFNEKFGYCYATNDEAAFYIYNQDIHVKKIIAIALEIETQVLLEQLRMGVITEHECLIMLAEWNNQLAKELQ